MNIKEVKSIIDDFKKSDLMSLELETNEFKLKLSKRKDEAVVVESTTNNSKDNIVLKENVEKISKSKEITAPLVGTFYSSANPNEKAFVEVGQKVEVGDVLCIIEAMKIMNEITSDVNGIISEVVAVNDKIVGYGDVLFKVEEHDRK